MEPKVLESAEAPSLQETPLCYGGNAPHHARGFGTSGFGGAEG